MRHRRAVEELHRRLDVRLARTKRQPHQPLHAMSPFQFPDPNGLAAVVILRQHVVDRHERRVAVMVERAPFDSARDPGAQHADQGGLDHVLAVEEVIAVGLVDRREQPPAEFRQDAQLDELVFKIQGLVRLVLADVEQMILERIRVNPLLGSLVRLMRVEHWVGIGGADLVGRHHQRLLPHLHPGLPRRPGRLLLTAGRLRRRRPRRRCFQRPGTATGNHRRQHVQQPFRDVYDCGRFHSLHSLSWSMALHIVMAARKPDKAPTAGRPERRFGHFQGPLDRHEGGRWAIR